MKKIIYIICFLSIPGCLLSQELDSTSKFKEVTGLFFSAARESIEWYDYPIAAGFIVQNLYLKNIDLNIAKLAPFKFEKDIQNSIGKNGRISLGSMDQAILPAFVTFCRLSYVTGLHLFTDKKSEIDEYKHPFIFIKTLLYSSTITELTKDLIYKNRPDDSDERSFFSGHSSTTFASSTFLYREIDDYLDKQFQSDNEKTLKFFLKISAFTALYGWSTYVGFCRLRDNKHYLIDVLTGATIGILVGNYTFDKYFSKDKKNQSHFDINLLPGGLSITYNF